ncbi:methyltransferase [Helicobacter pametensis]|uniref:methyltransferase n=1 Tax=Helicobacter pametensis TaxID=95149 RepID=UPI000486F1B6|nr:methyltransferase [Helicobacter pametensis]
MRLFSFDSHAKSYSSFCEAQTFFARSLVSAAAKEWGTYFGTILDLGCGSGEVLRQIHSHKIGFQEYIGCDLSQAMLDSFDPDPSVQHHTTLLNSDFDTTLKLIKYADLIISSSALQWSPDLEHTLHLIAQYSSKIALSIMTSETLKTFHHFLDSTSPLPDPARILKSLEHFFDGEIKTLEITLSFQDNPSLIAHLRGTGIMGGGVLSYHQAKKILKYQGDLNYQSLLFVGKSKK